MTKEQINNLMSKGLPAAGVKPELVETHISWVLIGVDFVYKIKKPIQYSFLDFSTVEKRKYYCEREIELNRRLTKNVYLNVLPVKEISGDIFIDGDKGEVIDYAIRMRTLNREKQMDILLQNNKVTDSDINNLAQTIAAFHKGAKIIYNKNILGLQNDFNDLTQERDYLEEHLGNDSANIITKAIATSDAFIKRNEKLLVGRLAGGFFRDCHGDLHSRNIFLLPEPTPFDCIEFNDDFRQIDVLNEVAFLCMDLDAFNRRDLSGLFFDSYNKLFPVATNDEELQLFVYYKSYRANIRAKVNSLRAASASDDSQRKISLKEAYKYLNLMDGYLKSLSH